MNCTYELLLLLCWQIDNIHGAESRDGSEMNDKLN